MAAKQTIKRRKARPKVEDTRTNHGEDRCGCCALLGSSSSHILSEREIRALDMMRKAREDATGIKDQILRLETVEEFWVQDMAEELLSCCERLHELRNQWDHWDDERMDAAEERMRLLGHIQ